eukprot:TRINITY_DN1813_c0_g1_i1.p2 TRINITY_DN1813_c0_g1~~TRINITY_DN1813_c0_g1_i1.p2  ORF type:complete len:267 (+),score=119.71 TRINITY_DN1813_c0_g1_i1:67-801(+)
MAMHKMLYAAAVLAVAFNVARAEEDEDELDESRARLAGLELKTIFPSTHPNEVQITAGQQAKALITFENNADTTFNLEFINAHLAHPSAANQIAQNLTGALVNRTVHQGEAVSVEYKFASFKELEPKDYRLVLQVHFMSEDDNERAALPAFNETVFIQDGSSAFDLQGLFLALLIGGVFFLFYHRFTGGKKTLKGPSTSTGVKRVTSTSPVPDATNADESHLEYVSAQHMKASRGRSGSPKKRN